MRKCAALLLVLSLGGCGGGGSSNAPTPPTTQPGPTAASITVTQSSQGQLCFSPAAGFSYRLRLPIRISESAGLGANINFARLTLFLRGVEVERREIGSAAIIAGVGTNRLNPRETQNVIITFDFNNDTFDSSRLEINFSDDRGNVHNIAVPITNLTAQNSCTI
jgi:hypothetical protein